MGGWVNGLAYIQGPYTGSGLPGGQLSLPCPDAFITKVKADGSGLAYSTFLGGSEGDVATAIAVDSAGDAYIAGSTDSFPAGAISTSACSYYFYNGHTSPSIPFPTTSGAYKQQPASPNDIDTYQSGCTLPTVEGDAFVAELSPDGSKLLFSTLLGGSGKDFATGIALDSNNPPNVYVSGATRSSGAYSQPPGPNSVPLPPDFPELVNPSLSATPGGYISILPSGAWGWCTVRISGGNLPCLHGFVAEVNQTGGLVHWSYLAGASGSSNEAATAIAVDSENNVYVTGATLSPDFPTTSNAFQTTAGAIMYPSSPPCLPGISFGGYPPDYSLTTPRPCSDAFVTELTADLSELVYSSYLGGEADDMGLGIALDSNSLPNVYVTGATNSTKFPTSPTSDTTRVLQTSLASGTCWNTTPVVLCPDAFVTKVSIPVGNLVYSTYLGGNSYDFGMGIAVDGLGDAFVVGMTGSSPSTFPLVNPVQTGIVKTCHARNLSSGIGSFSFPCPYAFVTELNPSGSAPIYSTFLGGSSYDLGSGIALDSLGNAYITGSTISSDFPTTANAFQPTAGGLGDAFVAKISPVPSVGLSSSSLTFNSQLVGTTSSTQSVTLTNTGTAGMAISSVSLSGANAANFALPGNTCPMLTPPASCASSTWFFNAFPRVSSFLQHILCHSSQHQRRPLGRGLTHRWNECLVVCLRLCSASQRRESGVLRLRAACHGSASAGLRAHRCRAQRRL